MEYDNLHLDLSEVDGYDKDFNYIISEREAGKTTGMWKKAKAIFNRNNSFLLTRREKVSISEAYINDSSHVINKFINDPEKKVKFYFKRGELEKGIVDVACSFGKHPPRFMFRCVALSNKMADMKSLLIPNCECIFFDEFIVDVRAGEKYLPNEAWRFNELYNTFQREATSAGKKFKAYFFGNPYSKANPYFVDKEVDISKLKRGSIYIKGNVLVYPYEIKPELKKLILERNPLYQFDNAYTRYAFDGISVNDANMILKTKQPKNFSLMIVVRIDNNLIGIYKSQYNEFDFNFWVGPVFNMAQNRMAYAFDFGDLQHGTMLIDSYGKKLFFSFAESMRMRKVAFANPQYGMWAEEIYNYV